MSIEEIFRNLESKEHSVRKIIGQVLSTRAVIGFLVEALFARDDRVRYESAGLLRLVAGASPQLLYPHFNSLRDALETKDSLLRGDILNIIRHIAHVDSQRKIPLLAKDYGLLPAL